MRPGYVLAVFAKEWLEIRVNRTLVGAVVLPAVLFAAIPIGLVALLEVRGLDDAAARQISQFTDAFPDLPPKLAAQGFIVVNFMAYFLMIPAMVPMSIAAQSVIGERQARSLEPQLATPMTVAELLVGKALAAALPAVLATWGVFVAYGLVTGAVADPRLINLVFSEVWIVAMGSLVPLICLFSVLMGILVSSRVSDPRTAQQIGSFLVVPIIVVAILQFFGGQATFTIDQVLIGNLVVVALVGLAVAAGAWIFDRESILTRLG